MSAISGASAQSHSVSSTEVRTAQLAKNQQEAEGQAALKLIDSATQQAPRAPSGNSGQNINISV